MKRVDLRKTHDRAHGFDVALVLVALFGVFVAWVSFGRGGAWSILGFLALVGEALLFYASFIEPKRLIVTTHRVPLVRNPSAWVRIVFLSDLHAGEFRPPAWYERIASEVMALHPDLAILGGDYVVDRCEPVTDLRGLTNIHARLGKYYVMGNHDLLDRPGFIRETIQGFGYADLTNRTVMIESGGKTLELHGIDDVWEGSPKQFKRSSPEVPHLLISHEPDTLMNIREGQTDLVLIGHTHGGQVRLPLIGSLWPIPSKMGRAADRGRKTIHGTPCIISDGLGETDGRTRLFSPPEIVVVEVGI